jgi:hypothetical protein
MNYSLGWSRIRRVCELAEAMYIVAVYEASGVFLALSGTGFEIESHPC